MEFPQKTKNIIIRWYSNSTSGYRHKISESRDSNKCLCTHVHSSIIHKSQKTEAAQSVDRLIDKQNVVYTYNGIWFSRKKEENSDTCYNMDELRGHDAQWNRPVTKGQKLYDSTYISGRDHGDSKIMSISCGGGSDRRGDGELLFNGYRVSVLQNKEILHGWWWWLHNNANVLNATKLYTLKWLR